MYETSTHFNPSNVVSELRLLVSLNLSRSIKEPKSINEVNREQKSKLKMKDGCLTCLGIED